MTFPLPSMSTGVPKFSVSDAQIWLSKVLATCWYCAWVSPPDGLALSARGYHRVLKVARTIADLDGADAVGRVHLAEALAYRASPEPSARAA